MSLKPVAPGVHRTVGGAAGARAALGGLSLIREEGNTMLADSIRALGVYDGAAVKAQAQQQELEQQHHDAYARTSLDEREVEVIHCGYLHKQVTCGCPNAVLRRPNCDALFWLLLRPNLEYSLLRVVQGGARGGRKSWKRRWFVLKEASMYYYRCVLFWCHWCCGGVGAFVLA